MVNDEILRELHNFVFMIKIFPDQYFALLPPKNIFPICYSE